jgi:phosphatidylglycerol---prolipoprotein diacylglyceryl transferase
MPFSPMLHLAFESGGLTAGGLLYWRQSNAATQPTDRWTRIGLLAGAAVGAGIGSRGLYMLQYWSALTGQPLTAWLGGKTIVGGLLGAILGVETAKRLLHWQASTGDGFVVPLMVAMVIGRIGCQLSGLPDLTYGNVTTLPWGWDYGDGLARHPTAVYEIFGIGVLAWFVMRGSFTTQPGDRFRAFVVGYLLLRIGLDFLKPPFGPASAGALAPERWGALSVIQWACIAGVAYYGWDILRWVTQGRPPVA